MSKKGDFLSGFSGGNTQKPLTEQNLTPVKEKTDPTEAKKTDVKKETSSKVDVVKNKRLADKIVAEAQKKESITKKPASTKTPTRPDASSVASRPAQSASAIIKAPEHVVTKDEEFHKRKMFRYVIIGIVAIVIAIIAFFIFRMVNSVEVPDWRGQELSEVRTWPFMGGASVDYSSEYSLDVNEGLVISQNREPGTTMSRNSVLSVVVSKGPDMNEVIDLPEFEEMTRAQIRTWTDDYQIRGVVFNEENSVDVEANHVIRVEFPSAVDPDNFRRSDSVRIYVSTGPETIPIRNLIGNNREEVDEFITENPAIDVEIEYEPHDTIELGIVLAQDPSPGTRLVVGETLTLTLSGGDPVVVPNFAEIRRVDAEEMENDPEAELDIRVHRRWNATISNGRFVSQSIDAGEELFGEMPTIIVVYSEGRPWMPDLVDTSLRDLESTIIEINDKGSSITIAVNHVNSYRTRGTIISQTSRNQFVAMDEHVIFNISLENLEPPEDYVPPDPPEDDEPDNGDDWDFDDDDWDFDDDDWD